MLIYRLSIIFFDIIGLLQRSMCTCALLYGVCTSQSAFKTHVLAHLLQDQVDCDVEDQCGDDDSGGGGAESVDTGGGADHDETLSTHCKGVHQQHICKPPPTHHWPHSCCNNSLQQITPPRSNVVFPLFGCFSLFWQFVSTQLTRLLRRTISVLIAVFAVS